LETKKGAVLLLAFALPYAPSWLSFKVNLLFFLAAAFL
jgi:hypothetical protein